MFWRQIPNAWTFLRGTGGPNTGARHLRIYTDDGNARVLEDVRTTQRRKKTLRNMQIFSLPNSEIVNVFTVRTRGDR